MLEQEIGLKEKAHHMQITLDFIVVRRYSSNNIIVISEVVREKFS